MFSGDGAECSVVQHRGQERQHAGSGLLQRAASRSITEAGAGGGSSGKNNNVIMRNKKRRAEAYLARFWLPRQKWRLEDWVRFNVLRYETATERPTVMATRANRIPPRAVMMIPQCEIIEVDAFPYKEPNQCSFTNKYRRDFKEIK